ncbi:MAG: AAA family ATPase [Caldilineaceae bacterium]|nr:AAA family ATPase [Caldilineaceae bacterium]MDE0313237.1 AAA family ATPase [Caldilineaceae bacterium]
MTTENVAGTESQPPRGARFYRCALQVNPHHYSQTYRGEAIPGDALSHAQEIVDKAVELGIEVLAITDHNSVNGVAAFRAASRNKPVHIFPGFELSSFEGVHLLCLYPPGSGGDQLERFLGEFGIRDTSPSSALANKSFADILETVHSQAGIAVAAHVTNDKGLFKVPPGQPRIRAWQDENLLAIQIPGVIEDLPHNIREIVENRNDDYHRVHAPKDDLAVAVVNAKDVVKAEQLDDPSATCWIKMQEVTIDGLRQAFLDPGSRIRLNSKEGQFAPDEHIEIVTVGWEGGFLDGVTIRLNPNLNVLIGGRGTGKSTVVESIRSALGLEPIGEEARKAHDGIVRHVLRNGTKISLLVRVQRPAVHAYRIERTIPNPPLVREMSGEVLRRMPADILPKVEAYGQHEISELARSPDKLIRLLDRFVASDESLARRKASVGRDLAKNRGALSEARAEIESIEESLAALPRLEETLERFQEVGLEERLREQSLLVREERVLGSFPQRLAPFREALSILRRELPIDLAFLSDRALEELPGRDILSQATAPLTGLQAEMESIADSLEQALTRANDGVDKVRTAWDVRRQEVQAEYERILRELQKSRVDGEEFIRLRRQVEALRPLQERLALLRRLQAEHDNQRRALLAEWEDVKAAEFRSLDEAARNVSRQLRNRVQVEVAGAANREPLFNLLRDVIGGRMSEAFERLRAAPELSLPQFVNACRSGTDTLRKTYGITPGQAERLADAEAELLMRIEELELPPKTAISLNTAPEGEAPDWQPLEDLSTGQKATAVLLLLLLESGAPLIVDQPEDDLDNRFITEGIVPRMREEKQRRQFIFSTHNANIPVLGDAELIVGLSAAGEAASGRARVAPEHTGSIDSRSVRDLVEEILEGGRDAFETRRRKYGF